MNNSFKPGRIWKDTDGKRIHAHGGSILYENDTYYWYGENKEKTLPGSKIWHWGVKLYSSKDLYNWTDEGIILHPNIDDVTSPLHPSSCMDRPHIIYNEKTQKYILWVKIMGRDRQYMLVAQSDTIKGPFVTIHTVKPCGINSGDFDLVKLPEGNAVIIFEEVHSSMIIADLTEDYTDVTGKYTRHFPHPHPPFVREAPACFVKDSKYYMFTSGTSGYIPNPSEVAVSNEIHGEWTVIGDPHINDLKNNSFCSQITSVFKLPNKDLYIALADRWLPSLMQRDDINGMEIFEALFDPKASKDERDEANRKCSTININTSEADYVWLPVEWENGKPVLRWYDEWRIEDF
ncbi:MAG: family 43 glycosylhydrolase [Clostridia bacterium]|nr:family 43 glycosylhydrolase [Clostridia bacterium]